MTATAADELLTPVEVAAILRTTKATLSDWRYRGRGPAYVKSGRSIRYRRAAVDAHLTAGGAR